MIDETNLARLCRVLNRRGVDIPFLGLDSLIKSKDTMREIDQWDVKILLEIKKRGH